MNGNHANVKMRKKFPFNVMFSKLSKASQRNMNEREKQAVILKYFQELFPWIKKFFFLLLLVSKQFKQVLMFRFILR